MKILFINGSPRGEKGSSSFPILKDLAGVITEVHENFEQNFLTLPRSMKGDPAPVLKQMEEADIWVFAMPLYVDTLPSHVLRWLMEYQKSRTPESLSRRVYAVVNSGFPEPEQNREALKVLELFCRQNGLEWRIGIGMGMGEPYKQMVQVPLKSFFKSDILRAYEAVRDDLNRESLPEKPLCFVRMRWPVWLYRIQGNMGWPMRVKQNGMKKSEIYARPYVL